MKIYDVTLLENNREVKIQLVGKSKKYIKELLKNKYEIISIKYYISFTIRWQRGMVIFSRYYGRATGVAIFRRK